MASKIPEGPGQRRPRAGREDGESPQHVVARPLGVRMPRHDAFPGRKPQGRRQAPRPPVDGMGRRGFSVADLDGFPGVGQHALHESDDPAPYLRAIVLVDRAHVRQTVVEVGAQWVWLAVSISSASPSCPCKPARIWRRQRLPAESTLTCTKAIFSVPQRSRTALASSRSWTVFQGFQRTPWPANCIGDSGVMLTYPPAKVTGMAVFMVIIFSSSESACNPREQT